MLRLLEDELGALPTNSTLYEVSLWDAIQHNKTETALHLIDIIHSYGDESASNLSRRFQNRSFFVHALEKKEYKVAIHLLELQQYKLFSDAAAFQKILKLIIESNNEDLFSSFLRLMNDPAINDPEMVGYHCNTLISSDNLGQNLLHYLANSLCTQKFSITVFKQLTSTEIDYLINQQDLEGNTPLHLALKDFHSSPRKPSLVNSFLENGARLDIPNDKGEIPFLLICKETENGFSILNSLVLSQRAASNFAEYYQLYLYTSSGTKKIAFDAEKMFFRGHTGSLLESVSVKMSLFAPAKFNGIATIDSDIYRQPLEQRIHERKKLNALIDLTDRWQQSFDSQPKISHSFSHSNAKRAIPAFVFLLGAFISYLLYKVDNALDHDIDTMVKKEDMPLSSIFTLTAGMMLTVFATTVALYAFKGLTYDGDSWETLTKGVEDWIKEYKQNNASIEVLPTNLEELLTNLKFPQRKNGAIKLFESLKTALITTKLELGKTAPTDKFFEEVELFRRIEAY